jgi:predicted house-cleaning noncanonical NTP pyrophosphatase (MazG superfamily)
MIIYNKLVRDKIPQIIEEKGKIAEVLIMDTDEYAKMLNLKLQEELNEFIEANENDQVEELADLVEVIYAILESKGVALDDFDKKRLAKKEAKGGFKDGLLLVSVKE